MRKLIAIPLALCLLPVGLSGQTEAPPSPVPAEPAVVDSTVDQEAERGAPAEDSIEVLEAKVQDLEARLQARAEGFAERLEREIEERIEREIEANGWEGRRVHLHSPDVIRADAGPLALWLVLFGFAALAWALSPRSVRASGEVIEARPGASLASGLAAFFLFLPALVIGVVVLAISIIGIPLLPLWVALLPAVLVVLGTIGTAALGRRVGERVLADTDRGWVAELAVGLAVIFSPLFAAWLFALVGISGLADLLALLGWAVLSAAYAAGLGGAAMALVRWRRQNA